MKLRLANLLVCVSSLAFADDGGALQPPAVVPSPDRGLYTLGLDEEGRILNLPYIKGGRILVQWAVLEPQPGRYDFTELDRQLQFYHEQGRKTTVQVNGAEKPRWLYGRIAVLTAERKNLHDAEGILQYWDPLFVDAYLNFVRAYGEHLRQSPWRSAILGIRQNFNAIGTEHGALRGPDADLSNWKPAPNGHIHPTPWSQAVWVEYKRRVVQAFIDAFCPDITVFMRNNIFAEDALNAAQIAMLERGELGLFHTSTEHQPRAWANGSNEVQYEAFLKYCRTGKAPGYAEPWSPADRKDHGGEYNRTPVTPCQFNYWRLLLDLHCGVSFIALKPADIDPANPEFNDPFVFAARYAGCHASPEVAPGAWVALREGDELRGDYTFLMERLTDRSSDTAVTLQGPADQRYGPWGRAIEPGGRMVFRLDPRFARSLKSAEIRIVYLDRGTGAFTVAWDDGRAAKERVTARQDSGRWKELRIAVPKPRFSGALEGGDVVVRGADQCVFHMVEVSRTAANR